MPAYGKCYHSLLLTFSGAILAKRKVQRMNQLLSVGAILSRGLTDLYDQSYALHEMQMLILKSCPALKNADIHVVQYQKKKLVLSADSQAKATRIRYLLPDLVEQLRREHATFSGLKSIKLTISVATP